MEKDHIKRYGPDREEFLEVLRQRKKTPAAKAARSTLNAKRTAAFRLIRELETKGIGALL